MNLNLKKPEINQVHLLLFYPIFSNTFFKNPGIDTPISDIFSNIDIPLFAIININTSVLKLMLLSGIRLILSSQCLNIIDKNIVFFNKPFLLLWLLTSPLYHAFISPVAKSRTIKHKSLLLMI